VEENSGTGVNDSGSSSSLAHSDVDKAVNSGTIVYGLLYGPYLSIICMSLFRDELNMLLYFLIY
jgi:hypothetical protein